MKIRKLFEFVIVLAAAMLSVQILMACGSGTGRSGPESAESAKNVQEEKTEVAVRDGKTGELEEAARDGKTGELEEAARDEKIEELEETVQDGKTEELEETVQDGKTEELEETVQDEKIEELERTVQEEKMTEPEKEVQMEEAVRSEEDTVREKADAAAESTFRARYLGVEGYGTAAASRERMNEFSYRFLVGDEERVFFIDNGEEDEKGNYGYPIQNLLKEGYDYDLTAEGTKITGAAEIPAEMTAYEPPVTGEPGKKTLRNFLALAMEPVGTTLYIYGGGWNWQDDAASVQAKGIHVSQDWLRFFREQDETFTYRDASGDGKKPDPPHSYYPYGGYNEYYYAGLDCSGYVGWVIYNLENTEDGNEGYVTFACDMAKKLEQMGYGRMTIEAQPYITPSTAAEAGGTALKAAALTASSDTATGALSGGAAVWKADIRPEDIRLKPGDVVSMGGHVWISLGTCSDGSTLLLHSTPSYSRKGQPGGGVQISAIGTSASCEAYQLADRYMSAYFPEWYSRYPVSLKNAADYFEFEDENTGIFSWTPGEDEDAIADPEGIQHMTPAEVLKELFEN